MFSAVQGGEGVRSDVHVPPAAEGDAGGQHLQAALLPHRQPPPSHYLDKGNYYRRLFPHASYIFFKIHSWCALNCNPEWSSYHAGYLICATTVTISVLWSPIQCSAIIILKWNIAGGHLLEIIDILSEYLSTYLRSPGSHCRLTCSRSRTRTASSPSRSSTASPATAASTSASPPTASAQTPPTASSSSRVSTNIFWRSNIFSATAKYF